MAGLTVEGLEILTLTDVISEIETNEKQNIDPNINTQSDELLGQLNTIFAAAIADQWELSQAVNDSFNPVTAEGTSLDEIGAITGTTRNDESNSTTITQLFTTSVEGTFIPAGTVVQAPVELDRFLTTVSETVDRGALYEVELVPILTGGNSNYEVVVSGVLYSTAGTGASTVAQLITALDALIGADTTKTWTSVATATTLTITTTSVDLIISGILNISITSFVASIQVSAIESGAIAALAGTVTTLLSTVANVTATSNPFDYVLGGPVETDKDYRSRILISQSAGGSATVPAIEDAVLSVTGVIGVTIVENRTFAVDGDGRPAKSFEVVVLGGGDAAIAQTIWDTKPAGIETFGSTSVNALDSNGAVQLINFSRPSAVNMAVRITYTIYDEETFPNNGEANAQAIVVTEINGLGEGVDVIPSRLFGPLYNGIDGFNISAIEIQVLANPGDTPNGGSWSELKQAIEFDEFATITTPDITFVGP